MAQQITCDICQAEPATQMLTNLQTGDVLAIGAACMPVFYGQSVLSVMDAGEHKSIPSKCQACRRVHERMTTPVTPLGTETSPDGETWPAQAEPEEAADAP